MRIKGRMFMCTLCTLDLKNELLIIHVLALLFCLLLFTAVGSITVLLWPLQICLSIRRSVDSPLGLLVKCTHGSESESESRTRVMTADPRQHLPADAVADLWSESAD